VYFFGFCDFLCYVGYVGYVSVPWVLLLALFHPELNNQPSQNPDPQVAPLMHFPAAMKAHGGPQKSG